MKEMKLLVWLTQLGLSAALPLAGFTLLGLWLRSRFGWDWAAICGIALGLICGIRGLWDALKVMESMAKDPKEQEPPPVSFRDHE